METLLENLAKEYVNNPILTRYRYFLYFNASFVS